MVLLCQYYLLYGTICVILFVEDKLSEEVYLCGYAKAAATITRTDLIFAAIAARKGLMNTKRSRTAHGYAKNAAAKMTAATIFAATAAQIQSR